MMVGVILSKSSCSVFPSVDCCDADAFLFGFELSKVRRAEGEGAKLTPFRRKQRQNPKQSGSSELHDQHLIRQMHNQQKHHLQQVKHNLGINF